MTQPAKPPEQSITWRMYSGSRERIAENLAAALLPPEWGDAAVVKAYIMERVPAGPTWEGTVRVTGYRTPVNDYGTGTAYISVHWEPKR